MKLVEGAVIADRFRLERELGRGGMGSVWKAHHTALDIPCAIKFIEGAAQNDADMRARFEREAKAAAQLRSPNVVQILDHGLHEGTPYIAMEYLEGEDLAHRIQRQGRLDGETTYRVVAQVARALGKAHAAGIVHRDLKPENVFLVRDDDGETAKVLDFGIAKRTAGELGDSGTKTGSLLGTPFYMSPEQARGIKAIDHRSDLWSLAVIVYECMTGQLPFKSDALGDLLVQIMFSPLPMPSAVAPGVPPELDAWWTRAAGRAPEERFQTAKDLVDALAPALRVAQPASMVALAPRMALTSAVELDPAPPSPAATAAPTMASATPPPGTAGAQLDGPPQRAGLATQTGNPTSHTFAGARPKKTPVALIAGLAAGTLALGAVVAFFALKSGGESGGAATTPVPATSAELAPEAPTTASAAPAATQAPPAESATAAAPSATASASAAPVATHAPTTTARPPIAKPNTGTKPAVPPGSKPTKPGSKPVDFGI